MQQTLAHGYAPICRQTYVRDSNPRPLLRGMKSERQYTRFAHSTVKVNIQTKHFVR